MLEITPAAYKAMNDFFIAKDKSPVRISILTGGCGIRFFGVTAAENRLSDERFDIDGFTYLVERKIIEDYGPIKVDSDGFSFRLSGGGIQPPSACGTCAFGCTPHGKSNCDGICRRCPTLCPTGRRKLAKRKKLAACI
jgi:iron-sulfur cluster assembly protein